MIDGCMSGEFTSFSTVFQSYQDDGVDNERLCAMISPRAEIELGPLDQALNQLS